MKLSEIKQILADHGIRLTKSLGQNFLHDGNQLRRIVAAAELQSGDKVLEIGPGLGSLTELLLEKTDEVLAIEKDRRMVEYLRERFADVSNTGLAHQPTPVPSQEGNISLQAPTFSTNTTRASPSKAKHPSAGEGAFAWTGRLRLIHDDALKYLRCERHDWSGWKLVANLPYSVASPILVELAQANGCPERMAVTLQLEVARRLIAKPDDEHYGLLTLLIQLRYEPDGWFKIPASCFYPAPDVDSACVMLIRRSEPLLDEKQSKVFTKIVKRAFSQRRKMMLKLLKEDWPEERLASIFGEVGLFPQVRAEMADLDQFVRLSKLLDQ